MNQQNVSRVMPESLAAEAAVLGSMIIDPQCIGEVVEQVGTDAFYRPEHQMIFRCAGRALRKLRAARRGCGG